MATQPTNPTEPKPTDDRLGRVVVLAQRVHELRGEEDHHDDLARFFRDGGDDVPLSPSEAIRRVREFLTVRCERFDGDEDAADEWLVSRVSEIAARLRDEWSDDLARAEKELRELLDAASRRPDPLAGFDWRKLALWSVEFAGGGRSGPATLTVAGGSAPAVQAIPLWLSRRDAQASIEQHPLPTRALLRVVPATPSAAAIDHANRRDELEEWQENVLRQAEADVGLRRPKVARVARANDDAAVGPEPHPAGPEFSTPQRPSSDPRWFAEVYVGVSEQDPDPERRIAGPYGDRDEARARGDDLRIEPGESFAIFRASADYAGRTDAWDTVEHDSFELVASPGPLAAEGGVS